MKNYKYTIEPKQIVFEKQNHEKQNHVYKYLSISIQKGEEELQVLNSFFIVEFTASPHIWAKILHHIRAILNGEEKFFKCYGEIFGIDVIQDKTIAVDTLSGCKYDENYNGYNVDNDSIPDICDRDEIETVELEKIVRAWYHAIIRRKGMYMFRIAVNASRKEIISILKTYFPTKNKSSRSHEISNYNAEIYYNEEYDETVKDDFLYYQTFLDFYRTVPEVSVEEKIQISKNIRQIFRNQGWKAEIIAEFEHLL